MVRRGEEGTRWAPFQFLLLGMHLHFLSYLHPKSHSSLESLNVAGVNLTQCKSQFWPIGVVLPPPGQNDRFLVTQYKPSQGDSVPAQFLGPVGRDDCSLSFICNPEVQEGGPPRGGEEPHPERNGLAGDKVPLS